MVARSNLRRCVIDLAYRGLLWPVPIEATNQAERRTARKKVVLPRHPANK
jgi:hypothetical protein